MAEKIQRALGRNAKEANPGLHMATSTLEAIGQTVLDSVQVYLTWGLTHDDGSALASSIASKNLRQSAEFSARSARMAYLFGKATLLDKSARRGIVRTQIIEYGSVAEAILLDLVQSVGKQDKPTGIRPAIDKAKALINWSGDGLLEEKGGTSPQMKHWFDFLWLTNEASRMGAIDAKLRNRIHWLRSSRNIVHPVIPTSQRYNDDIDASRRARTIVIDLRDAVIAFKTTQGLR